MGAPAGASGRPGDNLPLATALASCLHSGATGSVRVERIQGIALAHLKILTTQLFAKLFSLSATLGGTMSTAVPEDQPDHHKSDENDGDGDGDKERGGVHLAVFPIPGPDQTRPLARRVAGESSSMDAFHKIVGMLDVPMFVVTTRVGEHRSGCLVGFTSQVSITPPRFLVGLSKRNHTYRIAADGATHLAVHLLTREHLELARLFGGQTGDRVDKFARCAWQDGPEGMPILCGAAAWFVGTVLHRFDLGDHVGHLTEPVAGHAPAELSRLVTFSDVRDLDPGHEAFDTR